MMKISVRLANPQLILITVYILNQPWIWFELLLIHFLLTWCLVFIWIQESAKLGWIVLELLDILRVIDLTRVNSEVYIFIFSYVCIEDSILTIRTTAIIIKLVIQSLLFPNHHFTFSYRVIYWVNWIPRRAKYILVFWRYISWNWNYSDLSFDFLITLESRVRRLLCESVLDILSILHYILFDFIVLLNYILRWIISSRKFRNIQRKMLNTLILHCLWCYFVLAIFMILRLLV